MALISPQVAVIVEAVTLKAEEIAAVKADAERDLAEAKPALDAALAALNSISPKDITALKACKGWCVLRCPVLTWYAHVRHVCVAGAQEPT